MPKGTSRRRSRKSAQYERTGRQSRAYKSSSSRKLKQPIKKPSTPRGRSGGFINNRARDWRQATGRAISRSR